ncbi:hypothetical protein [Pseudomonas kurunegalensis]|uniref:hypothetical protein n=1 Tax=Pseudomonas kurunegalensis TaxID=485880 RepID=UPI0035588DBD
MKYYGVVYDVGLRFTAGEPYSVEDFNRDLVRHDINVIAKDLHANSIRIEGEEIDRLVFAAREAHAAGLKVFFNPWKMNVHVRELPEYFYSAAKAAESLRQDGLEIVFVSGCEITLFNEGVLPGSTLTERLGSMAELARDLEPGAANGKLAELSKSLSTTLTEVVSAIRANFKGEITYSAGTWESVDWDLFDIVGVDYYRNGESAKDYLLGLDKYRVKKPLVVMEVGSCTYEGAAARGAGGFMLLQGVEPDGSGRFMDNVVPTRSEEEQASYVREQLELLHGAGVDGVFIYVFSFPKYPTGEGAKDLDMMSFSLVKTFSPGDPRASQILPWAPKKSFNAVADFFKSLQGT